MATQEFSFKYLFYPSSAVIDDVYLTVKQGFRRWQVELFRLKHFFIHVPAASGIECLIGYETPEGKKKVIRFNANLGDAGFAAFADALGKARPEIDIRSMSSKIAHKLMGAVRIKRLGIVLGLAISVPVIAFIFMPALVHGLDSGSAIVDATSCQADCAIVSRNVTLANGYVHDEYLTEQEDSRNVNHYLLYVPEEWEKTDPVYLVVKTPAYSEERIDELMEEIELDGVLRNVLWEGLDNDVRSEFKNQWQIAIAPEARLIEYAADPQVELVIALAIIGLTLAVAVGVDVVMAVKNR